MGKVLVLYESQGGNTRHMADYVAEGARSVPDIDVRVIPVEEATADDALWADGIAAGTPTYVGAPSWRMKKYWDEIAHGVWGAMDGKLGCAFASQGGWGGGAELTCMSMLIIMMNLGMLTFGVTDYTGKQFTLHYGATVAGKPREEKEIEACKRLGKRLAQWVAVYFDDDRGLAPGPMKDRS